jgi:excisionase family DNA binding protein
MLLKVRDTAERLNVSESCVYQLIEAGKLPCHRIGNGRGAIRISEADLNDYLASCREARTGEKPGKAPRPRLKHLKL